MYKLTLCYCSAFKYPLLKIFREVKIVCKTAWRNQLSYLNLTIIFAAL
jgi:hypothetical protein